MSSTRNTMTFGLRAGSAPGAGAMDVATNKDRTTAVQRTARIMAGTWGGEVQVATTCQARSPGGPPPAAVIPVGEEVEADTSWAETRLAIEHGPSHHVN